jgi:hypothetical protein
VTDADVDAREAEMARYRRFDTTRAEGSAATATPPPALEDVRLRRAGLKAAMSGLEIALAAAAPNRLDDWASGVRESLGILHEVWTRHIVETEAPGAFLDELVAESPRLATPAQRLRREHTEILAVIDRAEKTLTEPPAGDETEEWVERLRTELTTTLCALARHRQRGADLVYEAVGVDLGGGY